MIKQLYFLHIPKTGGMSVLAKIKMNSTIVPFVGFGDSTKEQFKSSNFIVGHFGKTPITENPNISVACIVRDPIERSISNFIHSYNVAPQNIKNNERYRELDTIVDKLKYYLFQDPYYSTVQNLQSRSILNNMTDKAFENLFKKENLNVIEKNNNLWYLENNPYVLEDVIALLDSFEIVETIENHKIFYNKIKEWFLHNLNIEFNDVDFPNFPSTLIDEDLNEHTTQSLINSLTEQEKQNILDNNSIDLALYNYVKSKNE